MTEEERKHMIKAFEKSFDAEIATMQNMERERGDYMRRQPRVDPTKLSYNFEQYRRYTSLLQSAKAKDDQKSMEFYKLVKYVKAFKNQKGDNIVKDFTERQGYDIDMIDIPEEFQDLGIADVRPDDFRRKARSKRLIRTRSIRNLDKYDAWRCHDRTVYIHDSKHAPNARILVSPSDLVKVFGSPDQS